MGNTTEITPKFDGRLCLSPESLSSRIAPLAGAASQSTMNIT
jgi:hypothetical protein